VVFKEIPLRRTWRQLLLRGYVWVQWHLDAEHQQLLQSMSASLAREEQPEPEQAGEGCCQRTGGC